MTDTANAKPSGTSPFLYGGLILGAWGAIVGLAAADAINGPTALILMIAPLGLVIPMVKAANQRTETCVAKGAAQKRYIKRVALFTSLYLLALAGMTFAEKQYDLAESVRVMLAVLPGLAIIGVFWAVGRLIVEEPDEFMRMLIIRQSLVATGFALSAASVWGFLESADLVIHLDAYWWAVAWFFGLGIGAVANRIQYGTWGAV
jgi:hypothetical protein